MATKTLDLSGLTSLINNNTASLKELLLEIKNNQGELAAGTMEQGKALKEFSTALLDSQKVLKDQGAILSGLTGATAEAHSKMTQQLGEIQNIQQTQLQRLDSGFQSNTSKLDIIAQGQVDGHSKLDELLKRMPEVKVEEKGWKHYGKVGLKVLGCAALGSVATLGYQYAFGSEPQQQPQFQFSTQ